MVKVVPMARSDYNLVRQKVTDAHRRLYSSDEALNPNMRAVEYTRALTAAKLDRMFAKPFVAALEGHIDSVHALDLHPTNLAMAASGGLDGELRMWDITSHTSTFVARPAHNGAINGIAYTPDGDYCLSGGTDKTVKLWRCPVSTTDPDAVAADTHLIDSWTTADAVTSLYSHASLPMFVTAGKDVCVYALSRKAPVATWNWSIDSVTHAIFSPTVENVVACCVTDRSVCLYDTRLQRGVAKIVLKQRANALRFNPMSPETLLVGCEDANAYVFDVRNMSKGARSSHSGHVGPILGVDWAPTGRRFATCSYDRTVRIFDTTPGPSGASGADMYHGSRMSRVWAVKWTRDDRFILSASDDANIRIWRSRASEPLRNMSSREKATFDYRHTVGERYSGFDEVHRIQRQRRVPKGIRKAQAAGRRKKDISEKKSKNIARYTLSKERADAEKKEAPRQKVLLGSVE